MRRRFNRPRFSRSPFRRFRRRVSWQTFNKQIGYDGIDLGAGTEYQFLTHEDNDFVENHPQMARKADTFGIRRIVGRLRIAAYPNDEGDKNFHGEDLDVFVGYGIVIVKGDYDASGVWSQEDKPDPLEPSDDDDKWLFKDGIWLTPGLETSAGAVMVAGGGAVQAFATLAGTPADSRLGFQPQRSAMLSTDHQFPNGSFIDVSSRRRLEYGEKLAIVTHVDPNVTSNYLVPNLAWFLRVLTTRG